MRRAVPLLAVAALIVIGFSFAGAQSDSPRRNRLIDQIRIGHEVLLIEAEDRTAYSLTLLTDKEAEEARQVHTAAVAKAAEVRAEVEKASARLRDLRSAGERNIDQTEYSQAYSERQKAQGDLREAQAATRRPVHTVIEVGADFFAFERDENLVLVPIDRIVSVTRWKD